MRPIGSQRICSLRISGRFAEYLPFADFGDVFEYEVLVFMVGHDEKVLGGDDFCKAFVSVVDKRFSRSQYVEELFGHRLPALGPEARTDAAGHDDTIFVACHKL